MRITAQHLAGVFFLATLVFQPAVARAGAIEGAPIGTAGFVGLAHEGPLDEPVLVTSFAEFSATFGASTTGLTNPYLAPSVAAFFANGGNRLYVVRAADGEDAALIGIDGGPGEGTGLQGLLDVDEVSVVAIPGAVSSAVQGAMIAHCESAGDRMAVLDPESQDSIDDVLAQRAALSAPDGHAALYFPWVVAEPLGTAELLPPSGFVAGVYARAEPPDAPVGTIASAVDVTLRLTTTQSDALTQAGIDPIRYFSASDVRVWGARTISSDPEWRYIDVRRIGLHLEESIEEGTQWALLEENDAVLWTALRACVEDFLFARFEAGWFAGSLPEDAFFVRCDETTMTEEDIEEGRTVLLVGFAPLQSGEFVVLSIVLQRETSAAVQLAGLPDRLRVTTSPNPFFGGTTVSFHLDGEARADVAISDANGRCVRSFAVGARAPGIEQISWDGTDNRGARLPAGIYFVRIAAGSEIAAIRICRLR